jgi:hypothetical protein
VNDEQTNTASKPANNPKDITYPPRIIINNDKQSVVITQTKASSHGILYKTLITIPTSIITSAKAITDDINGDALNQLE